MERPSIQNNSGLSQGPVHLFGGRLSGGKGPCIATPTRIRHERAGCRGETGLGFRHRVGRGVFDPGPLGHASVGIRPGLKDTAVPGWQPPARDTQPTREVGSRMKRRDLLTSKKVLWNQHFLH